MTINQQQLHQWCNREHAHIEFNRSWVQAMVGSNQRLWNLYFVPSPLGTQLQWVKSKEWLAQNQVNVSEWSDMSTHRQVVSLNKHYKDPIKHVGLVQSRHDYHHFVECSVFSTWYRWKLLICIKQQSHTHSPSTNIFYFWPHFTFNA